MLKRSDARAHKVRQREDIIVHRKLLGAFSKSWWFVARFLPVLKLTRCKTHSKESAFPSWHKQAPNKYCTL